MVPLEGALHGSLLCTLFQMGGNPFGVPNIDAMAAFGFPGPNMNPQVRFLLNAPENDPQQLDLLWL